MTYLNMSIECGTYCLKRREMCAYKYRQPYMTFTINTELFIDRTATLYMGETWIRIVTNGVDQ